MSNFLTAVEYVLTIATWAMIVAFVVYFIWTIVFAVTRGKNCTGNCYQGRRECDCEDE